MFLNNNINKTCNESKKIKFDKYSKEEIIYNF